MNAPPNDPKISGFMQKWFNQIWMTMNWMTSNFIVPALATGTIDLSVLTTVPGNSRYYFSTAMTGNISITMPKPSRGAVLKVTHAASGGFTVNVGGLKTLSNGQWAEFGSDGTNWFETAFGSL